MSASTELSTRDASLPEKVRARHRDRQAIVYVRQSSLRQVEQNRESTRLQYGLADRACRLGWRREQVVVIDEDLGRSGASGSDRPGFQRLVAQVGLGHVGLVLGIEVSRLARSCRDWHQLLEMCALFDTLIGDADGIYDPGTYNDRLLLGLKGTMSEAELHILKGRMHEGRRAKALRGSKAILQGGPLPRGPITAQEGDIIALLQRPPELWLQHESGKATHSSEQPTSRECPHTFVLRYPTGVNRAALLRSKLKRQLRVECHSVWRVSHIECLLWRASTFRP